MRYREYLKIKQNLIVESKIPKQHNGYERCRSWVLRIIFNHLKFVDVQECFCFPHP